MLYRQLPKQTQNKKMLKDSNDANRSVIGLGGQKRRAQNKLALDTEQDVKIEDRLDERQEIMKVETFPSQACTLRWIIHSRKEPCSERWDTFDPSMSSNIQSFKNDSWSPVIMSHRSMISSSFCIGGDDATDHAKTLYGVAYSSLIVKSKSEYPQDQSVFIEGITLFPPGEEWIGRALYCCGIQLKTSTEKRLKQFTLSSIGTHHSICTSIFNRLNLDREVTEDKHLIAAVDVLFSDLLDPSSDAQEQMGGTIDHNLSVLLENLDVKTGATPVNQPILVNDNQPPRLSSKKEKKETY
jgi:hypothetical protein